MIKRRSFIVLLCLLALLTVTVPALAAQIAPAPESSDATLVDTAVDVLPVGVWYAVIAVIGVMSVLFALFPITRVIAENAQKEIDARMRERAPERVMHWYRTAASVGVRAVEQMKRSEQFQELKSLSQQEFNKALKLRATEVATRFLRGLGWKNVDEVLVGDVIEWLIDEEKREGTPVFGIIREGSTPDRIPVPAGATLLSVEPPVAEGDTRDVKPFEM